MKDSLARPNSKAYVLAGCRPWNRRLFDEVVSGYEGEWHFAGSREELTAARLRSIQPRYVFFLHWSWKVPDEIVNAFECVCFHMADVPYGRGGSPLQNLIVRGHKKSVVSAMHMTNEFDAGPVYGKEPRSLEGNAEEIYLRAGQLSATMMERIVRQEPKPLPQKGRAVNFKRRKPEQSRVGKLSSLEKLYDRIRMLDAEGYPRAFLEQNGFRFEFSRAALYDGRIVADVTITPAHGKESRK